MVKILKNNIVGIMNKKNKIDTMNAIITVVNMISLVTKHKVHRK